MSEDFFQVCKSGLCISQGSVMSSRRLVLIVRFGLNSLPLYPWTDLWKIHIIKKKKNGVIRMAFHVKRENKSNQYDFHAASGKPCRTPQTHRSGLPPGAHPIHHSGMLAQFHHGGWGLQAGGKATVSLALGRGFWLTYITWNWQGTYS